MTDRHKTAIPETSYSMLLRQDAAISQDEHYDHEHEQYASERGAPTSGERDVDPYMALRRFGH
jgi:hypothetical protein